jgi:gamma-glutamylcyclotransferase (GGCT)/AIG2-like uncharacterized protein YtfP
MSDVELVFVYGSLKQGFHNHGVMKQAQGVLVGPIISADKSYSLFSLGSFPALAYASAEETPFFIKGELYEVPSHGVRILDHLESGYTKAKILLSTGVEAWCYFLRPYGIPKRNRLFPMGTKTQTVEWEITRGIDT